MASFNSVFLMTMIFSQTILVQANPPKECSNVLKSVLEINKIEPLPPQSSVLEIDKILYQIEKAKDALKDVEKEVGPSKKVGSDKKYDNKIKPFSDFLIDRRYHLQAAETFGITSGPSAQDAKSKFNKIEEYGSPPSVRLYTKFNRITGIQILSDENRKTYKLDENCQVEKMTSGLEGKDDKRLLKLETLVNSKVCDQSKTLTTRLQNLPEKIRTPDEACKAVEGKITKRPGTEGSYCACSDKPERPINPWAQGCGTDLPEFLAKKLVQDNGGQVSNGIKPEVQKVLDLCAENSKLLQKSGPTSSSKSTGSKKTEKAKQ